MNGRILLLAVLIPAQAGWAASWDRDVFAQSPSNIPSIEEVVVGNFPLYPTEYYEDRLTRVTAELEANPDDLALYDDAGVAADRLGRHEEAILWMEKKFETMNRLKTLMDSRHRYTRLANLGTFLAHRALQQGKHEELAVAAQELERAVKLGPTAMFGRERAELDYVRWLVGKPAVESERDLPTFLQPPPKGSSREDRKNHFDRQIRGLIGLVALGDEWNSVDVFYALRRAYEVTGNRRAATLVQERLEEMCGDEGRSRVVEAGTGAVLAGRVPLKIKPDVLDPGVTSFTQRRAAFKAWQEARFAYIRKGVAEGRHPDTHRDFWADFDHPRPRASLGPKKPESSMCGCSSERGLSALWLVLPLMGRRRRV